jgi:hypothetical protein
LEEARLTGVAEGTLQIEPHEISLAKGQTISLDPTATISLDPKSAIKVDGQIELQAPSISTPQGSSSSSTQRITTITNFTVFKRVPFQNGVIMADWNFLTRNQSSPSDQYCYYSESDDNSNYSVSIDIAHDQHNYRHRRRSRRDLTYSPHSTDACDLTEPIRDHSSP